MKKKHFLVYKTTNLVNGKIYIGKHETDNLDDGYLGSGILIQRAIEKYGEENFQREILFECSTREEMNAKEAELVNEEFLKRDDVYNLKQGGEGGWDYCNTPERHNNIGNCRQTGFVQLTLEGRNPGRETIDAYSDEERKEYCHRISMGLKRKWATSEFPWIGRKHSEETKRKMKEIHAKLHLQSGERNSQFGTKCMYNEKLKKTIHVKPSDVQKYLDEGWKLGAVYNWESHFNKPKEKIRKEQKRKEKESKLEQRMAQVKQKYTEMYKVYCESGFDGVKEKFGYKFSQVNFVNQCKKYVDEYKPQNGKKRGK